MVTKRKITKVVNAAASSDGDGVKISRSIGSRELPQLDPFLLLDELKSDEAADYIGGFPSHPHRGFETVTYMLAGQMRHKDNAGHEGVVSAGDVQWMTAGAGIIHSEMPEQKEGRLWGFQVWINLPAEQKMRAPRYQEVVSADVPEVVEDDKLIRVLAGKLNGNEGPIKEIVTQPLLLDVQLKSGARLSVPVPEKHTVLVYVYSGSIELAEKTLQARQLGCLSLGELLEVKASTRGAGVLILAAAPLNEPIVRAGPFVMNTPQELEQAFLDFRSGRF